jgi:transcriptional regulator with XRE-family HTH domain
MISNDTKKERGKRTRIIRSMLGLSVKAFAKNIGYSDRTVKSWEHANAGGLTERGADKIIRAATQLGLICELTWLMHGIGAQPVSTDPVFNKPITINEQPSKIIAIKKVIDAGGKNEIACFHTNNANAITLQITDDSMQPYYIIGSIVGGKRTTGAEIDKILYEDCIVETRNKQTLCRRLTPGTMPNCYNLTCLNPNTKQTNIYDIELLSAARVIWYRKL